MRALKIPRDPEPSQDDVLERWAARRRDLLLAARLDRLDEPHAFIPRTADEVNPLDPGRYQVGGVTYVTWSDVPRCSCIDAQYHPGRCRHIALVRAYRAADSEGKAA